MINGVIETGGGLSGYLPSTVGKGEKSLSNRLFNTKTQVYTLSAWPLGEESIAFKCLHI